jgi:hypothetical protein
VPAHVCQKCNGKIQYSEPVVQLLRGPWYGAETPAFSLVQGEWHEDCFNDEFKLNPQLLPYSCEMCNNPLEFGQRVTYFVKGSEAGDSYSIAERRGHQIFTLNHTPECPQS